ncbi:hypothetical protein CTAYLR_005627 [Chrysophaeum taylorii]|uniref:amino-acid N-acetyltransferase n=1 Tax=Chrysophaeum taylorii TaxID=2483200 RepID=A0AAD7XRW7_9STRA|nr:hypothetical protein CTAYLR_005627 [Chrysophaeum taylorii]
MVMVLRLARRDCFGVVRSRGVVVRRAHSFGAPLPGVELRCNTSDISVASLVAEETSPYHAGSSIVELLRGSAPYIELHQKSIVVIHVASEIAETGELFQSLMDDVATLHVLGVKVALVASVRYQVDTRGETRRVRGRRVTGPAELAAVQIESGVARSRVEAALSRGLLSSSGSAHGRSRVGVDVVSGNGFYTARPVGVVDGVDLGATGTVRNVDTGKIQRHLDDGEIVLLTALGYSASGETFNVQTEEVAAKAAPALGASKLVFVTPVDLVFRSGRRVPSLRVDDAKRLVSDLGDKPQERYVKDLCEKCVEALAGGVVRAHLVPPTPGALLLELYTRDGAGTLIASDIYEGIRAATPNDITRILKLIKPLETDGTLVKRPRDTLEADIAAGCYYVLARDDRPIACAMLKRFLGQADAAELGCLVVDAQYRRQSKADALLSYCERVALANNVTDLFALSTATMQWFLERGFDEVDFDDLPDERQHVYDDNRKPKIYRKRLVCDREVDFEDAFWTKRSSVVNSVAKVS